MSRFDSPSVSIGKSVRFGSPAFRLDGEPERASFGTGGGVPLTANQVLLASVPKDGSAILALSGGSRQRYNGIGGGTQVRSYSAGPESWARALSRRYRFPWYNSSGIDTNGNGMSGMIFAADGEAVSQLWQRIPAIIASDAQIVVIALSSNSLQLTNRDIYGNDLGSTPTAAGYWAPYQQVFERAIAGGKPVICVDFWERHTTAGNPGPVWASGSQTRLLVPTISSYAAARCAELGIPFFSTRPTMVNFSDPDLNPIADLVQSDGTHANIRGGLALGKAFDAFIAGLGFASTVDAVDETVAGNLLPNPAFANNLGTGVLGGTWQAGSVVPDGWTLTRLGTGTATVRSDFVTIAGRRYLKVTYLTPPSDSTQESWTLKPTSNLAVTVGDRHYSRMRVAVDAFDGYYGNSNASFVAGSANTATMMPTKPAGGGVTDMTDLTMHAGPTEAYAGVFEGQPNLPATSTAGVFTINGASIRAGGTTGAYGCAVAAPEVRTTTNPAVIMYDEANTTPPTLTSSTTLSAPEEVPFSTQLVASKSVRWSLTGTDAAKFTIDNHGLVRMVAMPNYELPGDANLDNVYTFNAVLTDFNPSVSVVTVPMTLTITNSDDGFTALFNGTSGVDLADSDPTNWTRDGVSGAITIYTNGAEVINDPTKAVTAYVSPQQGDTDEQQVITPVQTVSSKMHRMLRYQDKDNCLYFTEASGNVIVQRRNAGAAGVTVATFTPYKTIANGDIIGAQILNDNLEVWQNDAPLVLASGSRVISGALFFDGFKKCGLLSSQSGGSGNRIFDYTNRVAAPHADKAGLRVLTSSTLVGTPGQPFVSTISPVQTGSSLTASDTSGLFFTDAGNTLKASAPPAGTYTVTVTETNPNAATPYAGGRATVLTIVIS